MYCSSLLGLMSTAAFSCWPCTPSPSFVIDGGVALIPTPWFTLPALGRTAGTYTCKHFYGQPDTATKWYCYHCYCRYYLTPLCSA
ncbi:hypothetical protein TRIATDRAFT_300903 [Trichoderma atroviride IMI 206040]|uniref:Secreted protein n=1 Tax=Hypocrea atroviridis (strain ATCC 20476 / IMI 206040) TaxID=452589 RepID=G9P3B6_HYPAI|nr:uncharacterized protein TRIATDRAFT_300903 [Trichoderma atroviride IMI 206040]EHK42877.1 hypothetical protein TRIATDRAFT_300903 [Trichoderma atroviride IMI 206040]